MQKKYKLSGFLVFALCFASICMATPSFSQAIESRAEINKNEHPVFENTFPYAPEIVKGALLSRLKEDHISAKSKKNTVTCMSVVYPVLASTPLDLYFQIDGKRKGTAILKLFISKGKDNFMGKEFDQELSQKALDFLNHFQKDVNQYALQQQISKEKKDLEKAGSKYKKLLKDKQKWIKKEYDLKSSLSGTLDLKARKKIRKKLRKTDKKIYAVDNDIRKAENDLEQRKTKIRVLKDQLNRLVK